MSTSPAPSDPQGELGVLLGSSCPDPATLTPEEAEMLLDLIKDARGRQRAELDRGLEAVVGALPRFVRGPARAIVFGGSA